MVTDLFIKNVPLNQQVAEAAKSITAKLLERQTAIASMDYNQRTGELVGALSTKPFEVAQSDNSVDILINYPATIRFLDLKKTKSGKKKRLYTAIYNRPLFGHIYGRGYSLTNVISLILNKSAQAFFDQLKITQKVIEL